ncbi:unnamed protein product, partial [Closterium sp. Naga37s-1]
SPLPWPLSPADCADILAAGTTLPSTIYPESTPTPNPTTMPTPNRPLPTTGGSSRGRVRPGRALQRKAHVSPRASPQASPHNSPHASHYKREPGKCWSRAELPCYAANAGSTGGEMSERLEMKMRQYHTYRRECLLKEPKETLRATLLSNKPTLCRYLVYYHTRDGQGNRLVSLMSAFAYALLTDRILLLASGSGLAEEYCEPFEHGASAEAGQEALEKAGEDASWVLFDGPDREKYVWMLRFKVAKEWRSVREEEESGSMVPPVNRIWAQLTRRFHSLIAPASARIGLQGRFQKQALERGIPWETKAMGRCLIEALNSSSVQQAREVRLSNRGGTGGDGNSGSGGLGCSAVGSDSPSGVTEVMVASLSPVLAHNLSVIVAGSVPGAQVTAGSDTPCAATAQLEVPPSIGVKNPAGSHVHIARLTVDESENNTDTALVDRAILDIYTLALFSDALVISRNSTFGYVSASLFGVPYVSFVGPTCIRAITEPCLHFPPSNDRCPDGVPQQLQMLLAVAPDVPLMPCADRPSGIAVRPLEM